VISGDDVESGPLRFQEWREREKRLVAGRVGEVTVAVCVPQTTPAAPIRIEAVTDIKGIGDPTL